MTNAEMMLKRLMETITEQNAREVISNEESNK